MSILLPLNCIGIRSSTVVFLQNTYHFSIIAKLCKITRKWSASSARVDVVWKRCFALKGGDCLRELESIYLNPPSSTSTLESCLAGFIHFDLNKSECLTSARTTYLYFHRPFLAVLFTTSQHLIFLQSSQIVISTSTGSIS